MTFATRRKYSCGPGGNPVRSMSRSVTAQRRQTDVDLTQLAPRQLPTKDAQTVSDHRAGLDHLLGEAGEQLIEQFPAAGVQHVHVTVLRHPSAVGRVGWQDVPLAHCHVVVGIGQDPGGQQTGHARAEYHNMVTDSGQRHIRTLPASFQ